MGLDSGPIAASRSVFCGLRRSTFSHEARVRPAMSRLRHLSAWIDMCLRSKTHASEPVQCQHRSRFASTLVAYIHKQLGSNGTAFLHDPGVGEEELVVRGWATSSIHPSPCTSQVSVAASATDEGLLTMRSGCSTPGLRGALAHGEDLPSQAQTIRKHKISVAAYRSLFIESRTAATLPEGTMHDIGI